MDVSIIIVNYNTKDLISNCLKSIFEQTVEVKFEIIVVDNASIDGSQQLLKNNFPNILLIESPENLGFGKANNLGAKHAKGKYLFLLNSDTELIENSIKFLIEYFEQEKEIKLGAVGCKLVNKNLDPQASFGNFPSIYQELFEYGLRKIFNSYYNKKLSIGILGEENCIRAVDYLSGADILIQKKIFDSINGFDEDFFLYYEETEMCFRLKKRGYEIIWNPLTKIIHIEGASSKNNNFNNYLKLRQYYKSKFLYYKKCHGIYYAKFVKFITVPKVLLKNGLSSASMIIKL